MSLVWEEQRGREEQRGVADAMRTTAVEAAIDISEVTILDREELRQLEPEAIRALFASCRRWLKRRYGV